MPPWLLFLCILLTETTHFQHQQPQCYFHLPVQYFCANFVTVWQQLWSCRKHLPLPAPTTSNQTKQRNNYASFCSLYLSHPPPLPSLSQSWFHLAWQICGSHGRRCYKCSVTALNTAGSEHLGSSRMQLGKWVTTLCPATPCLTAAFISHFNCEAANCSVPPRSAGLVLMLAGEKVLVGASWRENRKGKACTECRRTGGGVLLVRTKNTHIWLNGLFDWRRIR